MSVFNQLRHLLIEERHQQRSNVRTVNVRIGHNDDFFVTQIFFPVVFLDAATQRLNHVFDFLILGNLVKRSAGYV